MTDCTSRSSSASELSGPPGVFHAGGDDSQAGTMTSIMLRNLPNNLRRDALLSLFDTLGFQGCYDFVYLPRDFSRRANVGYAFVNCTTGDAAERLKATFDGFCTWPGVSRKVCAAIWSEPDQGLDQYVQRYRNSPVMHKDVPEECRPLLLAEGQPVPFPPPTKSLKKPKMKFSAKDVDKVPYWHPRPEIEQPESQRLN